MHRSVERQADRDRRYAVLPFGSPAEPAMRARTPAVPVLIRDLSRLLWAVCPQEAVARTNVNRYHKE